mgnify:CR=1 FL=1
MVTKASLEATMSLTTLCLKPRMLMTRTLEATTMMMVSLEEKVEAMKKTGDASSWKVKKLSLIDNMHKRLEGNRMDELMNRKTLWCYSPSL